MICQLQNCYVYYLQNGKNMENLIDIILNFIGTLIGMLGEGNMYEPRTKRRKKRTTQNRTR